MSALPTSALAPPRVGTAFAVPVSAEARLGRIESDRAATSRRECQQVGRRIVYKIAQRREDLHAAFGLVYQAYLWSGLTEPNPYRMRVTPYQVLPTTEVYVVVDDGEVVCTMSLVGDGELGLPMETIYPREIAWLRAQGIRLGEVSCLANRQEGEESSFPMVVRLMGLMAQCARQRGIDALVIAVHPRHAKFYERFIAFTPIGGEKSYGAVCDNPAVALALDLNRLSVDHPRVYQRFFGTTFPEESVKYRPLSDELRFELSEIADATYDAAACGNYVLLAAS